MAPSVKNHLNGNEMAQVKSIRTQVAAAHETAKSLGIMTSAELKQSRKLLGYTQDELAEKIGMCRKMIGMMERGQKPIELRTGLAVRCLLHDDGLVEGWQNEKGAI